MARLRHPQPPAVEGTVAFVLCNEKDCFPRILCFLPFAVGLIIGLNFLLNPALSAAPGVLVGLAAAGLLVSGGVLLYCAAGLPHFRRHGCLAGCGELPALAARALERRRAPAAREYALPLEPAAAQAGGVALAAGGGAVQTGP